MTSFPPAPSGGPAVSPAGLRLHPLALAIVAALLAILVFHQICAALGFPFHRSQHVGTALLYARGTIDLLHPVIEGFNANQAPAPQELPLWQAAVALFFRHCGESMGWALLVSWLMLVVSIPPVYWLARAAGGADVARWTVWLYLMQPLVFFVGANGGPDGLCLAVTIWFFYFADRHVRTGSAWAWCGAAVFGVLSALTKAPFFLAAGAATGVLLVQQRVRWPRWLSLAALGGLAGCALMAWTRHCNACYARAEFPYFELRMDVNPHIVSWYFGTWAERLDLLNWGKAAWRILFACFGSWALAGLALVGLLQPAARTARAWLLGGLLSMLVFFHLIVVATHRHYYLMLSPALAMLGAVGVDYFRSRCTHVGAGWMRTALGAIAMIVIVLAAAEGFFGMESQFYFDRYPGAVARRIQEHTQPEDRLLLRGTGWGDPLFRLSGRSGLSWDDLPGLEHPETRARLKELGFTKLVVVNESPLGAALQQVNPGESERKRHLYSTNMPAGVQAWPTVYADEDVLIKGIP